MNILVDELPKSVTIEGKIYPVNWGFRTFLLIEICIFDTHLSDADRVMTALELFYGDNMSDDINQAFEKMMWFYRGGKEPHEIKAKSGAGKTKRCYCFEQDAPYIYSAFRTQYGIDLQDISNTDMHWWKFKAMFESLSEDLKMSKIMYYRTVKTSGMDKDQRAFINDMKKLYALDIDDTADSKIALAKRDTDMKNYVRKRMSEVGHA